MKNTVGKIRAAIDKYNMIDKNDNIAVGISGGKDSLVLLWALNELKKYYPNKFNITAITLDPCFNGKEMDLSEIKKLCDKLDIKYVVNRTSIWEVVFKIRNENNPCSLCAKLRRGILHNIALENGCNKVALGHHMDDAVETFFMNIFNGGKIKCFSPMSYLSRKNIHLIRPMIFCYESEISNICSNLHLPVCKSMCPIDGNTERENIKITLNLLEKQYPKLRKKVIGALQDLSINNW